MPHHLAVTLVAALMFMPRSAAESRPEGSAGFPVVISGDTLALGTRTIRLNGIKSPTPGTICRAGAVTYSCGDAARQILARLIGRYAVSCEGVASPRVYPVPAICRLGKRDLNKFMLIQGWAVVDRLSCGALCLRYERIASHAEAAGRGIWQGELPDQLLPVEKRREKRRKRKREQTGVVFDGWWH